jgi:hypothetical protein
MSMSTHVYGVRPPDKKWKRMKAVYDSCEAAGVEPPEEVSEFFGYDTPDPDGVVIELEQHESCAEVDEFGMNGYDVDLSKLPKDVTILRFRNSW